MSLKQSHAKMLVKIVGAILCAEISLLCLFHIDDQKMKTYQEGWNLAGALQAVAQSPNEPNVHIALGSVYFRQRQYPLAVIEYRKAVRLDPQNPYIHLDLGKSLASAGQKAGAHREWKQAIRLDVASGQAQQEAKQLQKLDP